MILGSHRTIYKWDGNIRHSLGMLRPQDPASLQGQDLVRLKATVSHAGGQIADSAESDGFVATARPQTSEICGLCGRDVPPGTMSLVPHAGWF